MKEKIKLINEFKEKKEIKDKEEREEEFFKRRAEAIDLGRDILLKTRSFLQIFNKQTGTQFIVCEGTSFFNPETNVIGIRWEYFDKLNNQLQGDFHKMLASFSHEVGHLIDFQSDPETFLNVFENLKYTPRPELYKSLYNYFDDRVAETRTKENLPLVAFSAKERYRQFLFPTADFRDSCLAIQFLGAILRTSVVPEEAAQISEEVKDKIQSLNNFQGMDILAKLKNPKLPLKERYGIIKNIIEPIFKELLEKDPPQEQDLDSLAGLHGDFVLDIPLSYRRDLAQYFIQNKDILASKMLSDTLEKYNITPQDAENYRRDYETVKPHIEEMAQIFKAALDRRKILIRELSRVHRKGHILEPGLIYQAYLALKRGETSAPVFRKLEKKEKIKQMPREVRVTLIGDGSSSMQQEKKDYYQGLAAVLILEGLNKANELAKKEKTFLKDLSLEIKNSARIFAQGDAMLKNFNQELNPALRVFIHKNITHCDGGATYDAKSLEEIDKSLTEEDLKKLKIGELVYWVMVFSDGESHSAEDTKRLLNELRKKKGVEVLGVGITKAGAAMVDLYAPDSAIANQPKDLIDISKKFLIKKLSNL